LTEMWMSYYVYKMHSSMHTTMGVFNAADRCISCVKLGSSGGLSYSFNISSSGMLALYNLAVTTLVRIDHRIVITNETQRTVELYVNRLLVGSYTGDLMGGNSTGEGYIDGVILAKTPSITSRGTVVSGV